MYPSWTSIITIIILCGLRSQVFACSNPVSPTVALKAAAGDICDQTKTPAAKVVADLKARGFMCILSGKADPKNVQKCWGRIEGYPEGVLMYVPDSLDAKKALHFDYHFHGFNLGGQDPRSLHFNEQNGVGDFATWMNEAEFNGIIVAPISQGNCTTFKTFFDQSSRTNAFFTGTKSLLENSINSTLKPTDPKVSADLAITSHSGSDVTVDLIAKTLDPKLAAQVTDIGMFDSMYHQPQDLIDMAKKNHVDIFDAYLTGNSGSTVKNQPWFIDQMKKNGIDNVISTVSDRSAEHMTLMSKEQYALFLSQLH